MPLRAGGLMAQPAHCCPVPRCARGGPSVSPAGEHAGPSPAPRSAPVSGSPEAMGELQEGEASPAHIHLQGGLGVGGHDPGGHTEDHAVLEKQALGELLRRGGGRERGCESSQGHGEPLPSWAGAWKPSSAPSTSPPRPPPRPRQPPTGPTGLDASSRERWRETSPGKLASGKARPST